MSRNRHTFVWVWCCVSCLVVSVAYDGAGRHEPVAKTYVNLCCAEIESVDCRVLRATPPFGLHGDDPIVLAGEDLPTLRGTAVDRIVAFRFHNGWEQIPVQIDERKRIDIAQARKSKPSGLEVLIYADPHTLVGRDDEPAFDADDELVFMAADAGELAPESAGWPAGTLTTGDASVRLVIRDTVGGATGYVYLFLSDGTLKPDAGRDYVSYEFRLLAGSYPDDYKFSAGPNPENSVVTTPSYRIHFADRWVRDELNIVVGGAAGMDILDRHKFMFSPGVCARTEDTFSEGGGGFIANIDGPVRAIRSYVGANSGFATQRDHHFYARRHDVTTFQRVHPISGVTDVTDYSPEARGMRYYNDGNLGGVLIDGQPDEVMPHPVQWEMVTGEQGTLTLVHRYETDIETLSYSSFYSDDATPERKQCTGDAHEYGTSGPQVPHGLPNTDPRRSSVNGPAKRLVWHRTEYFDPPWQNVKLAEARALYALKPFEVVIEPFEPQGRTQSLPGLLVGPVPVEEVGNSELAVQQSGVILEDRSRVTGQSGCQSLTSDFTPPTGKTIGPGQVGPWNNRLMSAVSADGLTFTRTNRIVTDQGDVPDMIQDSSGCIYLYYTGWTVGSEQNKTVVAISADSGRTWTYKKLNLSGFEGMASPVDPDVQLLADGTFRLYLTSEAPDGQGPRTYYAEGRDGITFVKKGVAFAQPGRHVLDPSTVFIGSTWHIFAGGNTSTPGANWYGTSDDGTRFTFRGERIFKKDGLPQAMANGIAVPDGYRFYTFSHGPNSVINSFFTTDGATWTADPGMRLSLDTTTGLERSFVKDPAVVRLKDGSYLMVYVTQIP